MTLLPAEKANADLEKTLLSYCRQKSPGYAILLKGKWGCGKTWFAEQFKQTLETQENQKALRVSLNGITKPQQIQEDLFYQLHPKLDNPGIKLLGKVIQGGLKSTLKIDLNNDSKDDFNLNLGIPEGWQTLFNQLSKCILIFDDLERCQMSIESVMGYINSFIEGHGLGVIIIADETKFSSNDDYWKIKEKYIGKTYEINLELEEAVTSFIDKIANKEAKLFLTNSLNLITEVYYQSGCKNLRTLAIVIADFEFIYQNIADEYRQKSEVLSAILKLLIALSVEIKQDSLKSKDIVRIPETFCFDPDNPVNINAFYGSGSNSTKFKPDLNREYSAEEIKTLTNRPLA